MARVIELSWSWPDAGAAAGAPRTGAESVCGASCSPGSEGVDGALGNDGAETGSELEAAVDVVVRGRDCSRPDDSVSAPESTVDGDSAALADAAKPPSTSAALSATDVLAIRLT